MIRLGMDSDLMSGVLARCSETASVLQEAGEQASRGCMDCFTTRSAEHCVCGGGDTAPRRASSRHPGGCPAWQAEHMRGAGPARCPPWGFTDVQSCGFRVFNGADAVLVACP